MKKTLLFIMITCVMLLVGQATIAQSDRELTIKAARAMETAPFDQETVRISEKAERWITETKDVTVGLCGGVVGQFADKKYKYVNQLLTAYDLAMAAFKLENASQASDERSAQLAGVESVLKTYQAILKEKPQATSKRVDELLTKRTAGQLQALIESIDCSRRLD